MAIQTLVMPDELAALRCDLRSGILPDAETVGRLLYTIEGLQKAMTLQAGRIADDLVQPGQVHAIVDSRVPELPETIGRRA